MRGLSSKTDESMGWFLQFFIGKEAFAHGDLMEADSARPLLLRKKLDNPYALGYDAKGSQPLIFPRERRQEWEDEF
jgi:hypothetical protein